jgi:hypothetical protein
VIALALGLVIACGVLALLVVIDILARMNRQRTARKRRERTQWIRDKQTEDARRALRVVTVGGESPTPSCRRGGGEPPAQPREAPK